MKKILLFIGITLSFSAYGQLPVDSADWTSTTTNSDYMPIFNDVSGYMKRIYVEYLQPFTVSDGKVVTRRTSDNLILGGATNPNSDKLRVVGTSRVTGNSYNMSRIYVGPNSQSYFSADPSTGEIKTYDPVNGEKTITQLASYDSTVSEMTISDTLRVGVIKVYSEGDSLKAYADGVEYNLFSLSGTIDTLRLSGGDGWIAADGTSIQISPSGGLPITFINNAAPYGRSITGLGAVAFITTGGTTYLQGFRNDTTDFGADSAMVWSIDAVKEYVLAHGGGAGTITGTMVDNRVPYGATSTTLETDAGLTYDPVTDNLTAYGLYAAGSDSYLDPETSNGETAIANRAGTSASYSSNAKVFQAENNGVAKFYVKNDTVVVAGNLRYGADLYSKKYAAITDTFGVVMYNGGRIDTASLAFAANAWDKPLEPWDEWYGKSKKLKALPLPMPNGKERRKMNPLYANYQTEYTLETLAQYMDQIFKENKRLNNKVKRLKKENERKSISELKKRVTSLEERLDKLEHPVIEPFPHYNIIN